MPTQMKLSIFGISLFRVSLVLFPLPKFFQYIQSQKHQQQTGTWNAYSKNFSTFIGEKQLSFSNSVYMLMYSASEFISWPLWCLQLFHNVLTPSGEIMKLLFFFHKQIQLLKSLYKSNCSWRNSKKHWRMS